MSNRFNVPAPTPNEIPNERRRRYLAERDHNHTPAGSHIELAPTQDADSPQCEECGRTIIIRADELQGIGPSGLRGLPESWQHSLQCSSYEPHPSSVAGQPGYGDAGAS